MHILLFRLNIFSGIYFCRHTQYKSIISSPDYQLITQENRFSLKLRQIVLNRFTISGGKCIMDNESKIIVDMVTPKYHRGKYKFINIVSFSRSD